MSDTARILIFTGDGKGKTTAALGMALRAAGHDIPVHIVQFIKSDKNVGEMKSVKLLPQIQMVQTGRGFLPGPESPDWHRHTTAAENGLIKASEVLTSGACKVLVLDEVCIAVSKGLLKEEAVIDLLRKAPADACVVLTGRGATPGLIEMADTVTEMRNVKHGFKSGKNAQKGVEM